jgi:hypothetical protein
VDSNDATSLGNGACACACAGMEQKKSSEIATARNEKMP